MVYLSICLHHLWFLLSDLQSYWDAILRHCMLVQKSATAQPAPATTRVCTCTAQPVSKASTTTSTVCSPFPPILLPPPKLSSYPFQWVSSVLFLFHWYAGTFLLTYWTPTILSFGDGCQNWCTVGRWQCKTPILQPCCHLPANAGDIRDADLIPGSRSILVLKCFDYQPLGQ